MPCRVQGLGFRGKGIYFPEEKRGCGGRRGGEEFFLNGTEIWGFLCAA